MLEFAHRFRGADIITPRLDLSQSFVPKRGPDSGETADLEVARGARGAPTFGGLLLAFLATCPTKNASRRIILDGRRDLTHPGRPHPKGNAEDVLNRRNSKYKKYTTAVLAETEEHKSL